MDENQDNKSYVSYKENTAVVEAPIRDSVVIYSRPSDVIKIDIDISNLNKEIIGGDLVISTYTGGKITIANYGVMLSQGLVPVIIDSLGVEYDLNNIILGGVIHETSDSPNSIVISQKVSSANTGSSEASYLSSSASSDRGESSSEHYTGLIDVEQQSPIISTDEFTQPYAILTLLQEADRKYSVDEVFAYNGSTILNQDQPGTLPTAIQAVSVQVDAYYGAKYTSSQDDSGMSKSQLIKILNGGGSLLGTEGWAKYMYTSEHLDFSSSGSLYLTADESNVITRGMNVGISGQNVYLMEIRIEGVPDGVTLTSTEFYRVLPYGSGSYKITPLSTAAYIDLFFSYEEGMAETAASIVVQLVGYNTRYNTLLSGTKKLQWEFKEVNGENDISNYNSLSTFTFSTSIDTLVITTSQSDDDYVVGGRGNHTYYLLNGNNVFVGGVGNEKVVFGDGNNSYYHGLGNNTIIGGTGVNTIYFQSIININAMTKIVLDGGIVNVAVNYGGVTYNTTMTGMDILYLDDEDNTVYINSTSGFNGFEIRAAGVNGGDVGSQNDVISLGLATTIDFMNGWLTTMSDTTQGRIIFRNADVNQLTVNTFYGSNYDDVVWGSSEYGFTFYGNGGTNTLRYDNISDGTQLQFYAYDADIGSGRAVKTGGVTDIFTDVRVVYGTSSDDTFYGSGSLLGSGITYNTGGGSNTVSYERENVNGVIIDFTNTSVSDVVVRKTFSGATSQHTDYINNASIIIASNGNDKFIVGVNGSNNYDGLEGRDEISYEGVASSLVFNILTSIVEKGASGNVSKASGNVDIFSNIQIFTGGSGDDRFLVSAYHEDLEFYGSGGENTLSYADMQEGVSFVLDFSSGNVSSIDKYLNGVKVGSDSFVAIQRIITGNENDTFIFDNPDQLQSLNIVELNAGGSKFTAGERDSLGNALQFNNGGTINVAEIASRVLNFNSLVINGTTATTVVLTAATSLQFSHIYASTASRSNTLDASSLLSGITFNINVATGITSLEINDGLTYFFDFNQFSGTMAQDTFNVTAVSDKSIIINGTSGGDILNYSNTSDTMYLKFDLSDIVGIYQASVSKSLDNGNTYTTALDRFANILEIHGGDGGNLFVLSASVQYNIVGGKGYDTVSFANSLTPISSIDFSRYTNIDALILSDFDDTIEIDYTMTGTANSSTGAFLDIDAGGGTADELFITNSGSNGIVFDIGGFSNDTIGIRSKVTLANGFMLFKNFQIINGSSGTVADTYNIYVYSNVGTGVTTSLSSTGYLYFNTKNIDKVDYSKLNSTQGLTVYIGESSPEYPNNLYIVVEKETNAQGITSTDFYNILGTLILSDGNDTIKLDITTAFSYDGISIDMGGGSNTIDFSVSSAAITLDTINNTIGDGINSAGSVKNINIKNWHNVIGSMFDDVFIAGTPSGLSFDGREGSNTLSYASVTSAMVIDAVAGTAALATGGSSTDAFTNIQKYIGAQANTTFYLIGGAALAVEGNTQHDNIISYEKIDFGGSSFGFTFYVDASAAKASGTVYKTFEGNGYLDTFSGISTIVGTANNDTFEVAVGAGSAASTILVDGGLGSNSIIVTGLDSSYTGVVYNLITNQLLGILSGGSTVVKLLIKNIQVMTGTENGNDTFVIDSNALINNGSINGYGGTSNKLDATAMTENALLDIALGRLYLYTRNEAGNVVYSASYVELSNIQNIVLGKGDDIFVINSVVATAIKSVDGGEGKNTISLRDFNTAVNTNINNVNLGTTTITISNFSGYEFTQFDDYIIVDDAATTSYTIDGYLGEDTLDYQAVTSAIVVTLATEKSTVVRGSYTDTIYNIDIFKLNKDGVVNIGIGGNFVFDGKGTETLKYDSYEGSIYIDFTLSYIYKFASTGAMSGVDTFSGISNIYGTKSADTYRISSTVSGVSAMNIYLGSGISQINLSTTGSDSTTGGIATFNMSSSVIALTGTNWGTAYNIRYANESSSAGYSVTGSNAGLIVMFGDSFYGNTYIGNVGALDKNTLNYSGLGSTYSGIIVDFSNNIVTRKLASGTTYSDYFNNFQIIVGTKSGNDTFQGLNNYTSYTIDGGGGSNTVSYSASLVSIHAVLDASGNATINKGGTPDTITSVKNYVGTSNNDTFQVHVGYFAAGGGFIDGGGGTDTLIFVGGTGTYTLVYGTSADTINGNSLAVSNFDIFQFGLENETITSVTFNYTAKAGDSISSTAHGTGVNTFTLNTVSGVSIVVWDASTGSAVVSGPNYSLSLSGFNAYNLVSTANSSISLNISNYDVEATGGSPTFAQYNSGNAIRFNTISNLQTINLDTVANVNLQLVGTSGTVRNTNGVYNIALLGFTAGTAFNFNTSTSSNPYTVLLDNNVNMNFTGTATGVITLSARSMGILQGQVTHNVNFAGNDVYRDSTLTTTLNTINVVSTQSFTLISNITFTSGAGSISFTNYSGNISSNISIGSTTTTANQQISMSLVNDITITGATTLVLNSQNSLVVLGLTTSAMTIDAGRGTNTLQVLAVTAGTGTDALIFSGNSYTVGTTTKATISNFTTLDLSAFNGTARTSYTVQNFSASASPNSWSSIILPTSVTTNVAPSNLLNNIVDFSNSPSGSAVTLSLSFIIASAGGISQRLMQASGSYANGSIAIENARSIVGTSNSDGFTFAYMSQSNISSLFNQLSGNSTSAVSLDQSLQISSSGASSYLSLSSWGGIQTSSAVGDNLLFFLIHDAGTGYYGIAALTSGQNAGLTSYNGGMASNVATLYLPRGGVFVDGGAYTSNWKIITNKNDIQEDYVIYKTSAVVTKSGGNTAQLFTDGNSTSGTSIINYGTYTHNLQNVTVFQFQEGVANYVTVGSSENGELYRSNKVRIHLAGNETASDLYINGTNTVSSDNTVDLSNITSGTYFFGLTIWNSKQYKNVDLYDLDYTSTTGFGAPDGGGVSGDFSAFMRKFVYGTGIGGVNTINQKYFQVGLGMVQYTDRANIFSPSTFDNLELFYGFKNVNHIILTAGNNTFATGRFLNWSNNASGGGYFIDNYWKTTGNRNTDSADSYTRVKRVEGTTTGVDQLLVDQYYYGLFTDNTSNPTRVDRIWTFGNFNNEGDDTVGYTLGTANHDPAASSVNKLGATFVNFNIITMDDYGAQTSANSANNVWHGMDDKITINTASLKLMYYEVDLGGRHITQPDGQTVTFVGSSEGYIMTWGFDTSNKIDSVLMLRGRVSGQVYIMKNWDSFTMSGGGTNTLTIGNNFDFDVMVGKTFTINLASSDSVVIANIKGWYATVTNGSVLIAQEGGSKNFTIKIVGTTNITNESTNTRSVNNGSLVEETQEDQDEASSTNVNPPVSGRSVTWWDSITVDRDGQLVLNNIPEYVPEVKEVDNQENTVVDNIDEASEQIVPTDEEVDNQENIVVDNINEASEQIVPTDEEVDNQENTVVDNIDEASEQIVSTDEDVNVELVDANVPVEEAEDSAGDDIFASNFVQDIFEDIETLDYDVVQADDMGNEIANFMDFRRLAESTEDNGFDMNKLFESASDMGSIPEDLQDTIDTINSISEEVIQETSQADEVNSISFALDDSTNSIIEDHALISAKKNSNDNNGNSGTAS